MDIYSTPGAEEQVRKWNRGRLITPTFDIDSVVVSDFDREALERILKFS